MEIPWEDIKKEMEDFLYYCAFKRVKVVSCKYDSTSEYLECREEREKLYNELQDIIPESGVKLLFDYKNANLKAIYRTENYFYEEGFKDGFCTFNILNNKCNEFYEFIIKQGKI